METFYRTHSYLVEHTNAPVRRDLMDEIDWNDRLIGIKGTRGVGKTTFLLQYAKEKFGTDHSCLFINMNNFYFSKYTLVEFAAEFVKRGGKVLLIDQVFKYPEWSHDLRACYEMFPTLKIIFTGSSVMRLKEENPELSGIVKGILSERFLIPRISEFAKRQLFPCLYLTRNFGESRTDSENHPAQREALGLFSRLSASRFLPILSGKT